MARRFHARLLSAFAPLALLAGCYVAGPEPEPAETTAPVTAPQPAPAPAQPGEPGELPQPAATCAATLCPENSRCVEGAGGAECVPLDGDQAQAQEPCVRTGCSGTVCSDEQMFSTCEYRPEYACYQDATCERQADGECGWTETAALTACLQQQGS